MIMCNVRGAVGGKRLKESLAMRKKDTQLTCHVGADCGGVLTIFKCQHYRLQHQSLRNTFPSLLFATHLTADGSFLGTGGTAIIFNGSISGTFWCSSRVLLFALQASGSCL